MQVIQFVYVADVHFFFVQLCFVEVLAEAAVGLMKLKKKKREKTNRVER